MSSGSWLNKGRRLNWHHARLHMGPHEEAAARLARLRLVDLRPEPRRPVGIANKDGEQFTTRPLLCSPPKGGTSGLPDTPAGASGGGAGLVTTCRTPVRSLDLTGASTASVSAAMMGPDRGGLRLPLRRGLHRRWASGPVWSYTGVNVGPGHRPPRHARADRLRFRYGTDGGLAETGAFLDNIVVRGSLPRS